MDYADFHERYIPEPNSGCWLWARSLNGRGYGLYNRAPVKQRAAHRLSYELHYGPLPKGACVLHSCDTPACVNPAHLTLGSRADNNRERGQRGRTARGESVARARLTARDVQRMRECFRPYRVTFELLAEQFGVTTSAAARAVRGNTWRHVEN